MWEPQVTAYDLITSSLSVIYLALVFREQSAEMQPLARKCNHLPPIKHIFKKTKRIKLGDV